MKITKLFFTMLVCFFIYPLSAEAGNNICVYKDHTGVTHIENCKKSSYQKGRPVYHPPRGTFSRYRSIPSYTRRFISNRLYTKSYADFINKASLQHGVSKGLVRAVIHAESAFNPRAVSPKGALGLMQLMPENCRRYNVSKPFDPQQNINGGVHLLADLIRKYKGDLKLVLAAYNAGQGAVEKHNGIPPYSETQNYVKRVLYLKERYKGVI